MRNRTRMAAQAPDPGYHKREDERVAPVSGSATGEFLAGRG
ncbi:hypothetical protein [Escherichia coli]|nr:hypothetical protein [Escherichia coli]MDH4967670.1 hypothetical protein [Escherichia coli]MDP4424400.1 hypothetical protein [Escherichia coli]